MLALLELGGGGGVQSVRRLEVGVFVPRTQDSFTFLSQIKCALQVIDMGHTSNKSSLFELECAI